MESFDVIVIGAGPGGYPAAIRAAQLGASTAIVERESFGGTCLNWGCIPTKTLIAGADAFRRLRHASTFGIATGEVTLDYAALNGHKDQVVKKLRGGIAGLLRANKIATFEGVASFLTRDRIMAIGQEGSATLAARAIVIATGSESAMPKFIPSAPNVVESRAFLDLKRLPERLLVLGGGVIGAELACMAALLGVKVTIVEMLEDILLTLDKDVRRELRKTMERELGMAILTGTPMTDIVSDGVVVTGKVAEQTVEGDMLLVSVGRKPVTDRLRLDAAGLATDERGFIPTNAFGQTAVAGIYAVGDVAAGTAQLAHEATAKGVMAVENALGARHAFDRVIPACIFTHPEVGVVGLSEQTAKTLGREVAVGKFAFAGLGKAMAACETSGFVKWIADPKTDRILGAQAVGAHATELIAEGALAVQQELTTAEVGRAIHAHPTFSEAWMEAAHAMHGRCIHAPPARN